MAQLPLRFVCTRTTARVIALLEVLVVFAIVHIAWRSFKHFTALGSMERSAGLNFSPDAVMIAATQHGPEPAFLHPW
jgi:hypothetical protein